MEDILRPKDLLQKNVFQLEHQIFPFMPVFLAQTPDFVLQADDQIGQIIKFLPQTRILSYRTPSLMRDVIPKDSAY